MDSALKFTSSGVAFAPVSETRARPGVVFRASRAVILLVLGVVYAGGIQFFIKISPGLLYGTYLVIAACLAVCLFFDWSPTRSLTAVLPYFAWLCSYFLWGMLVASDSGVLKEGVKYLIKNLLIITALVMAVDRQSLKPFVKIVLIGVIANFGLCLWQTADPGLVERIAHTREYGATAYNVLRPAGLWSNPDEAATAFIFALILSRWAPGMLARIAQVCSVIGIFLTASRTGVYVLAICLTVFAWMWIRQRGLSTTLVASLCVAAFVAVITLGALSTQPWFTVPEGAQINRIFDFSESKRGAHEASRLEIAQTAIFTAMDGPWYGYGLFGFQHEYGLPTFLRIPAHNVFLVVLGEAGLLMMLAYVAIFSLGIWKTLRGPLEFGDQSALLLMWFCYLVIGLTWHNQFTAFSGMLYIGLLWHLTALLKKGELYEG